MDKQTISIIVPIFIALAGIWPAVQFYEWFTAPSVDLYVSGTANSWEEYPIKEKNNSKYRNKLEALLDSSNEKLIVTNENFSIYYTKPFVSESKVASIRSDLESNKMSEMSEDVYSAKRDFINLYDLYMEEISELPMEVVGATLDVIALEMSRFERDNDIGSESLPSGYWDLEVVNDGERRAQDVKLRIEDALSASKTYSDFYKKEELLSDISRGIELGTVGPKENVRIRVWTASSPKLMSPSSIVLSSDKKVGKNYIDDIPRKYEEKYSLSGLFYLYLAFATAWIGYLLGYNNAKRYQNSQS